LPASTEVLLPQNEDGGLPDGVEITISKGRSSFLLSKYYGFREYEKRNHPLLVQVVEELGADANGKFAELKVVEIPDGVDWTIQEYDGIEWVAEVHRAWE